MKDIRKELLDLDSMKNINHQKLTGEWCKHLRKNLKKYANRKRRELFKKCQNEQIKDITYD